jgi:hypothetical protein
VEEVCEGYETLELDISGGDGEMTVAQTIHGCILWKKRNIILVPIDSASGPASPSNMSPPSQPTAPQHSPSPPPGQPSPPSPHPLSAKKQKLPSKTQSVNKEPPKKKQLNKKEAKEAPKLPWHQTYEECHEQSRKEVDEHFKKKQPEKKEPIDPTKLAFFIGMAESNRNKFIPQSDCDRSITKSFEKKKKKSAGSSSDVPQLGAQKKQSIPPQE